MPMKKLIASYLAGDVIAGIFSKDNAPGITSLQLHIWVKSSAAKDTMRKKFIQ
jgi:hypothetical protein